MITRLTLSLLGTALLLSCTVPSESASSPEARDAPAATTTAPAEDELPVAVRDRIKADLASQLGIPTTDLTISQHSRETFSDSCLGLGGPAESCLAVLTEGWQVEVVYAQTGERYVYRSDLSGNQVRQMTSEYGLPTAVRDRIFATAVSDGLNPSTSLGIIATESRVWNGCYGLAAVDEVCTTVAIPGWRVVISDGQQYWVYHASMTDLPPRLNEAASGGTAIPMFIPHGDPQALGDETSVQSTVRYDSGVTEVAMLEADGRLLQIRSQDGEVLDRTIQTVSQAQIADLQRQLEQANFAHFDGIRYQSATADGPIVRLMTRSGVVEYAADSVDNLPPDLQAIIQQWQAVQ
jgi:hypothetical protein